jgi:secondary thiamine-phosphate synthase enzyme
METQTISTSSRNQMIDVTDRLQKLITQAKINDGMLIVYVPHTTAAVTINENADPDVKHDMLLKLSQMIPKDQAGYKHAEGNSDSHVKTALVGNNVTVLIENGRLQLGQWQGIYFCEFDGPRERQMYIKAVKFDYTS